MKNIHILPTNKPSYLYQIGDDLILSVVNSIHGDNIGRHIYITSYEGITGFENNIWVHNNGRVWLWQNTMALTKNNKPTKIILTTDQDLIKDGIQPIDDALIKFIVNHPFTKEETKQDHSKIKEGLKKSIEGKEHFVQHFKNGGTAEDFKPLEQETLEEIAEKEVKRRDGLSPNNRLTVLERLLAKGWFKIGYNAAQKEISYSEQEVESLLHKFMQSQHPDWHGYSTTKWFEHYKKH